MTRPVDVDPRLRGANFVGLPKRLYDPVAGMQETLQLNESEFLSQREGVHGLGDFLRTNDFSLMQPFMLDLANAALHDGRPSVYVAKVDNRNVYLRFPKGLDFSNLTKIYAIPKSSEAVGEQPYYWVDFYKDISPSTIGDLPLVSCRLKPEDSVNKIDFQNWRSLGEQLVIDFLSQKNGITFDDLMSFEIVISSKSFLLGKSMGNFIINLNYNSLVESGDRLRFIPRQDINKVYQWLDVIKVLPDVPEEELSKVSSYLMLLDEHKLQYIGWFGWPKQLLVDFMAAREHVTFKDVQPIPAKIPESRSINLGSINKKEIIFTVPAGVFAPGESVVFVPNQDEQGRYQWLELYSANHDTNEAVGECVAQGRIIDGRIDQANWSGSETQLLKDCADGKGVSFQDLVPLPFKKGKRNIVFLWGGTGLNISEMIDIEEGEDLFLLPEKEGVEYIDFSLHNKNGALMTYRFDLRSKKFTAREFLDRDGTGSGTEMRYIDRNGNRWVTANILRIRYGIAVSTAVKFVAGVPSIAKSGWTFYDEQEARVAIEKSLGMDNTNEGTIDDVMAAMLKDLKK